MKPKHLHTVRDFSGGEVGKVNPLNLRDNQSPETENMALEKYGELETRCGKEKVNTTTIGSVVIDGIKVYKDENANETKILAYTNNAELGFKRFHFWSDSKYRQQGINCIAHDTDENYYFVGTRFSAQIWRRPVPTSATEDMNLEWELVLDLSQRDPPQIQIMEMIYDPYHKVVVAVTQPHCQIWINKHHGDPAHWILAKDGYLSDGHTVAYSLFYEPLYHRILVGATPSGYLHYSSDGGNTWIKVNVEGMSQVLCFAYDYTNKILLLGGNSTKLKKSVDGGATWTDAQDMAGITAIDDICYDSTNNYMVLITRTRMVYVSNNTDTTRTAFTLNAAGADLSAIYGGLITLEFDADNGHMYLLTKTPEKICQGNKSDEYTTWQPRRNFTAYIAGYGIGALCHSLLIDQENDRTIVGLSPAYIWGITTSNDNVGDYDSTKWSCYKDFSGCSTPINIDTDKFAIQRVGYDEHHKVIFFATFSGVKLYKWGGPTEQGKSVELELSKDFTDRANNKGMEPYCLFYDSIRHCMWFGIGYRAQLYKGVFPYASTDWTLMGSKDGGEFPLESRITAIALDIAEDILIVGTYPNAKIYRSTDAGVNWTEMKNFKTAEGQTSINCLVFVDNPVDYEIYGGTSPDALIIKGAWTGAGDPYPTASWVKVKDFNALENQTSVLSICYIPLPYQWLTIGTSPDAMVIRSSDWFSDYAKIKTLSEETPLYQTEAKLVYDSTNKKYFIGTYPNAQIWQCSDTFTYFKLIKDLSKEYPAAQRVLSMCIAELPDSTVGLVVGTGGACAAAYFANEKAQLWAYNPTTKKFEQRAGGLAEDVIPDFCEHRGNVFVVNGEDEMQMFNGYSVKDVGLPRPSIVGVTLAAAPSSETQRPNGAGEESDWTASAGNAWECVDDVAPDDHATYIKWTTLNKHGYSTFAKADTTLPAGTEIKSITLYVRGTKSTLNAGRIGFVIRDTVKDINDVKDPGARAWDYGTTSYNTLKHKWVKNPFTGKAWTVTDINNLEFGVWGYIGQAAGEVYVTQIYLIINAAGGNLDGDYYYKIAYLSGTAIGATSASIGPISVKKGSVKISNITTPTDDEITDIRIYRLGGICAVFQELVTIDNAVTSYTDNIADGDLGEEPEIWGDDPPKGIRYIKLYKERLWGLGTKANPLMIYASDIAEEESFNLFNTIEIPARPSEVITGGYADQEWLFIACTNSWWRLHGRSPDDWTVANLTKDIGCSSNRSIVPLRGGLVFLWNRRFYALSVAGDVKEISEPAIYERLDLMGNMKTCVGYHNELKDYIEWSYSSAGCTEQDRSIRWYYKSNSWYPGDRKFSAVDIDYSDYTIYLGEPTLDGGGYIYKETICHDDDGTAYTSYWTTKKFSMGSTAAFKAFRQLKLMSRNDVRTKFNVYAAYDYSKSWTLLGTVQYDSAKGELLDSSFNLNSQRHRVVEFKFEATEADRCVHLSEFSIVYQRFQLGRY